MNMRQNSNTFGHLVVKLVSIEISIDFILTLETEINNSDLSSPKDVINNSFVFLNSKRTSGVDDSSIDLASVNSSSQKLLLQMSSLINASYCSLGFNGLIS